MTAALADHVLEEAAAAGEQDRWLAAAGWAVHARSVTGDGRKIACDVLAGLPQWGGSALAQPAARRLRVELAMVAAGAGEVDVARSLIASVAAGGDPEVSDDAELRADLLAVRARCAVEDAPDEVSDAISDAAAAWAVVGGPAGEFGGASVALVSAVVERRAGRPVAAVDHAADGLSRLERGRGRTAAASGHLAAALAAEWIAALLDAGRGAEARDGCNALLPGLSERARPTRQMALLRLTVARAVAAQDAAADTAQLLEQAAEDAAGSDVPDLEAVCRTALGALYEKASRLETALESLQLAVTAERRDRARSRRFVAALAELPPEAAPRSPEHEPVDAVRVDAVRVDPVPGDAVGVDAAPADTAVETAFAANAPAHARPAQVALSADGASGDATTVLPAITRGDRKLARRRWEELLHAGSEDEARTASDDEGERPAARPAAPARSRFERLLEGERAAGPVERGFGEPEAEPAIGWGGVSWGDSAGESPIGDLLIRSMGPGADEGGSEHRNGRTPTEPVNGQGAGEPRSRQPGRARSAERPETERPETERPETEHSETGYPDAAHSETETGKEPGGWLPAVDAARSDERRRRRGRTRSRSGSDAARREPRADQNAGTTGSGTQSGRAGVRGRHDRTTDPGDDPAPGRRHRERGGTDPLGVAPGLSATAHTGPDTADSVRESLGEEGRGTAPANGRRHRADDPWATGRWTVRSAERSDTQGPAGTPAEPVRRDSVAESPAVEPSVVAGSSDGWLEAALADLDRALSSGLAKPAAPEPDLGDDGCAVVIDIARDGRRFAGRRAGAVVRSVADRLTDRLPRGARLRFGDSDILSITGPGWSRSEATEWMHRTLPGLLDGFESEEDFPAAQLRAAVHDSDGPVGAQILQNLARSPGRRRTDPAPGAAEHGFDPGSEIGTRSSEARGREYRAAGRAGRRERADSTRSGTRSRRDAGRTPERPTREDDPGGWPWAGADADLTFADGSGGLSGLDVEVQPAHGSDLDRPRPGRHEGNGRAAGSSSDTDGPPPSRHRAGGVRDERAGVVSTSATEEDHRVRSGSRNGIGTGGDAGNGSGTAAGGSRPGDAGPEADSTRGQVTDGNVAGAGRIGGSAAGGGRPGGRSEPGGETEGGSSGGRRSNGGGFNGGGFNGNGSNGNGFNGKGTNGNGSNGGGSNGGGFNGNGAGRSGTGSAGAEVSDGKPDAPEPTDGLGIADLLAGALAAYRGI